MTNDEEDREESGPNRQVPASCAGDPVLNISRRSYF